MLLGNSGPLVVLGIYIVFIKTLLLQNVLFNDDTESQVKKNSTNILWLV